MPQEKFRSTCDSCAASKIKCTQKKTSASKITTGQEKPQCIRCRTLGKECHYSISRRAGRSRLHRKTAKPTMPPRLGTPTISPASLSIKPDHAARHMASNLPLRPSDTGISQKNNLDLFQFTDLLRSDVSSSSASSSDRSSISSCSNDGSSIMAPPMERSSISPSLTDDMLFSGAGSSQDWLFDINNDTDYFLGDLQAPAAPTNGGLFDDKCAKLATDTLNSLYEMPTTHVDGHGTSQPSVSQAMAATASAIQNTLQLMSCFCQKDFHLPVIIAVTVSKIIAWAQAIVRICDDPFVELPDRKFYAEELIAEAPLSLGTFQLEDEMGRVLKDQIILDQLRSVSTIVARFHTMFCNDGAAGSLGGQVYSSMGAFLDSRLQYTIQTVEGRLHASRKQ